MNGHSIDPDQLHKEGCDFGQKQAIHMEYILKALAEIKDSMKEDRELHKEEINALNSKIGDLNKKLDNVKEEVIKEVTRNEAQRKMNNGFISAGVSLIVVTLKEWVVSALRG